MSSFFACAQRVKRADRVVALVLAVALAAEAVAEGLEPIAVAVPAFAGMGLLLALRRIAPLACLLGGAALQLGWVMAGVPLHRSVLPLVFLVLALWAVGLHEESRRAVAGLLGTLGLVALAVLAARANGESFDATDLPYVGLLVIAPWIAARAMRRRVHEAVRLERRAEHLQAESELAATRERARIARELHDVIAHSLSLMVVQANAAEEVCKRDPPSALAAVRAVQETGRQALVEMSRLVGLLRADGDEAGLSPQPRLDELGALIAQVRQAGLSVSLHVAGDHRALPLGVELTAYRVVQEGLTNVRKHAGGAHTDVTLRYGADALEIDVVDEGPGIGNGHGGGHGLIGMRERVFVFGGDLAAGPTPGGGFAVHARLPLEPRT
jgi:signal transduction histidine kinase